MRLLFLSASLALGLSQARADFVMDMTQREIRAANGVRTIDDLAVGETGRLGFIQFCQADGSLFAITLARLQDAPPGSLVVTVKRESHEVLLVSVEPGLGTKDDIYRRHMRDLILSAARPCESLIVNPDERLRVMTFNGFHKVSDLLSSVQEP
jgi:hypothetical protein